MFYLSGATNSGEFYMTDTADNKTDVLTGKELYKIHDSFPKLELIGVAFFNYDVCDHEVIKLNQKLDSTKLSGIIQSCRQLHNPWSLKKLEWYLASAKIGTTVVVNTVDRNTSGQTIRDELTFVRRSYDLWECTTGYLGGSVGNTEMCAAWFDMGVISCHSASIHIV